jgi:hypothetical protein
MANKANNSGKKVIIDIALDAVELTNLNVGKISIDPMAPIVEIKTRTQLPNSIAKTIPTINFPPELGVIKMVYPPIEHFKGSSSTYQFELAQYNKSIAAIKAKIKASNLGEAGSVNNLPEYNAYEIYQQRVQDYEHFDSYLKRTGHDLEYDYDNETGRFRYNVGTYAPKKICL